MPSDEQKRTSSMRTRAASTPAPRFDVLTAAQRLLEGSLGVVRGERVLLVGDRASAELLDVFQHVAREIGAQPTALVLEDFGPRPLAKLPEPIAEALGDADASALLCSYVAGEMTTRRAIAERANQLRLRHAHMIGLTAKSLVPGFAAHPQRVLGATRSVRARVRHDSTLHVRSRAGTDLRVRLDARYGWWECTGIVRPGRFENFPSGRLSTCPADVNGVFVADASVAESFGAEAGLLRAKPLRVMVEGGHLRSVECSDRALGQAVESYLRSDPNGARVGLVHIGTNVGLLEPVGEIICDLNIPGVHLGFGVPHPTLTGATWDAKVQLAMAGTSQDVDLDGAPLLRMGFYLTV